MLPPWHSLALENPDAANLHAGSRPCRRQATTLPIVSSSIKDAEKRCFSPSSQDFTFISLTN